MLINKDEDQDKNMPTKNPIVYAHVLQTYDLGFQTKALYSAGGISTKNKHHDASGQCWPDWKFPSVRQWNMVANFYST